MNALRLHWIAAALCVWVLVVYWPGLSGPFMLDDFQNLSPLGAHGGIHSFGNWWHFVVSGNAGALGRSVSLASFTLNAQNWPADPWPFKATNLAIHMGCTALVLLLATRLFRLAALPHYRLAATACAAFWALHPMQISTTLYVIQRMAQLSTLFLLLGLVLWLHGRERLASNPRAGYGWMFAGIVGCGALAALSKENGALLPLFAWILDATVVAAAGLAAPASWRWVRPLLLKLPVILLAGYLASRLPDWLTTYEYRSFTLSERLASQGVALVDYLRLIFLPRLSGGGIFNDDFSAQQPALRVLISWGALLAVLSAAIALRRRYALAAAGVLWFFAGHVLESSVLPLELYFEHRNYLPLAGVALAFGAAAGRLQPRGGVLLVTAVVLCLSLLTGLQARVWGNELLAAELWPRENPDSSRAHEFAAITWQKHGQPQRSSQLMLAFAESHPDDPIMRLQWIALQCSNQRAVETYARQSLSMLRTGNFSLAMPDTLSALVRLKQQAQCGDLSYQTLHDMIEALLNNPHLRSVPQQLGYLHYLHAQAFAAQGDYPAAIRAGNEVTRFSGSLNIAFWQAMWSLESGNPEQARRFAKAAHEHETSLGLGSNTADPYLERLDRTLADFPDTSKSAAPPK